MEDLKLVQLETSKVTAEMPDNVQVILGTRLDGDPARGDIGYA